MKPSISIYCFISFRFVTPISFHYKVSSCTYFPWLTPKHSFSCYNINNLSFTMRSCFPNRLCHLMNWIFRFCEKVNWRTFSLTITLCKVNNSQLIKKSFNKHFGTRRASNKTRFQSADIIFLFILWIFF